MKAGAIWRPSTSACRVKMLSRPGRTLAARAAPAPLAGPTPPPSQHLVHGGQSGGQLQDEAAAGRSPGAEKGSRPWCRRRG